MSSIYLLLLLLFVADGVGVVRWFKTRTPFVLSLYQRCDVALDFETSEEEKKSPWISHPPPRLGFKKV